MAIIKSGGTCQRMIDRARKMLPKKRDAVYAAAGGSGGSKSRSGGSGVTRGGGSGFRR